MKVEIPGVISVDHIIWQPMAKCVGRCPGCYIANSELSKYEGPLNTEILEYIFSTEQVVCRQLTLSLDSFLEPPEELLEVLELLWGYYEGDEDSLPDLCVTVQDVNSLKRWHHAMNMGVDKFLKPLEILSVSSMPATGKESDALREECEAVNTTLNFNKVVGPRTAGLKSFHIGCRYSHQVYLVLKKSPLGSEQEPSTYNDWQNAIDITNKESRKMILDRCVVGGDCKAGSHIITVWPDGSATGCPYDTNHVVSEKKTNEETGKINLWKELETVSDDKGKSITKFCSIYKCIQDGKKLSTDDKKELSA